MASVLIATPAYGGQVSVPYVQSIMAIRDYCQDHAISMDVLLASNESLINRARNNLVATFMALDFDTLMFLDADIELSAESFARLLRMQGVRGAPVAMKHNFFVSLNVFKDGQQLKPAETPSEPFTADFVGTGCLLVDKTVLTSVALSQRLPRYTDPIVGDVVEYFPTFVDDGVLLSEDYGFCRILHRAGIPIWVCPVPTRHYGSATFDNQIGQKEQ